MQLSKREIQLLLKLIDQDKSITIKELANSFDVSIRTVKYDLDNIREWLKRKHIDLFSQRNKGIWFELNNVQKITLKNELLEVERFEIYADQDARTQRIILELLMTEEYLTISYLADRLDVSKNTIVYDLEKVDIFLKRFQVVLERRSGQGLLLVGQEKDCRLLMEYLIQIELTEYDIYKIMNQLLNPLEEEEAFSIGKGTEFQGIYRNVVQSLSQILNPVLLNQFNYAELLSISLRAAIAVCRLTLNHAIASFKLLKYKEELLKIGDIPFLLMQSVFKQYDLPLLEDEYTFISSNLMETNDQQDILQLTMELIREVSQKLGVPFDKDHQLLTNLFAHLSLRLGKTHLFVNEYNPFVEDIRKTHNELFLAISYACQQEDLVLNHLINDSFIAYITLHFLVSFEKQKREVVQVVYVCSTGLGVTNLIQQRIQEEIPNVEIVGFASVLNAEEMIRKKKPNLVISIFPIEGIHCPVIKVNAIPSKEDISTIQTTVQYLLAKEGGHISYHNAFRQDRAAECSEELSRDTIVKGYIIYEELRNIFGRELKIEYKKSFLLHVLLMVHRIIFQTQYTLEGNVDQEILLKNDQLLIKIEQLFSENELSVNHAELIALLQYVEL